MYFFYPIKFWIVQELCIYVHLCNIWSRLQPHDMLLYLLSSHVLSIIWLCAFLSVVSVYSIMFWVVKKLFVTGIHFINFSTNWAVFKDGRKEGKKKDPTSSPVKCYFVRTESYSSSDERASYILSNKTMFDARSLFMHAHTLTSLDKYMARCDTYKKLQILSFWVLSIFLPPPSHLLKLGWVKGTNPICIYYLGSLSFCQRP